MFRFCIATLLASLTALPALAHDGRRFEVLVLDNQIFVQGYISDGIDDGGGVVRPYYNALHGHFDNKTVNFASADLPGYDIFDQADELLGYDLSMTITGFMKWSSPDTVGPVSLTALDGDETIEVGYNGASVNSSSFGPGTDTLLMVSGYNGPNGEDLDFSYDFFGDNPSGELYVIQSVLSTNAPGIASSKTIYTLLSPDGTTMMEKLHHPSLFAEQSLGTPVPEPGTLGLLALAPVLLGRRRRMAVA